MRPERPEHRVNRHIRFPQIRVVAPDGAVLGVMSPEEGRAKAAEHGLDLVEVSPNARPPVCRIMDYGKFKYERSKSTNGAHTGPSVKTVQLRPKTDTHDLDTKLARARRFLERGDKVRLVMRMRGRENAYPHRWTEIMREHYEEHLADLAKVSTRPSVQGRAISMLIEPS